MAGEPFCNQCGHRNVDTANFCSSCGSSLIEPGDDLTLTLHVHDPSDVPDHDITVHVDGDGPSVLVVRSGADAGESYMLGLDTTTAGRSPEADIFLDDVTVSRRHALVVRVDGGYVVRDLGSLNGTYVNRSRISEARLVSGDELQIGKFRLLFLAANERRRADPDPSTRA